MHKYCFIIVIVLFWSCTVQNKENYTNKNHKIIHVNYKNAEFLVSTDSIIKELSFIQLQNTTPPIGNIQKLIVTKEHFIIWDKHGKSVWVFTQMGKLVSHIYKLGNGPKEYGSIYNVSFNSPNEINIVDAARRSILKFDLDGFFLNKKRTNSYPSDYIENNEFKYFFYYHIDGNKNKRYYLEMEDQSGYRNGFFSYQYTWRFDGSYFFKNNDHLYFTRNYDNSIYKIENDSINIVYNLDFGKNSFSIDDIIQLKDINEYYKLMDKDKLVGNISNLTISDNFLTCTYQIIKDKNSQTINFIYNLETGRQLNFEGSSSKKFITSPAIPKATDGNFFYDYIEPWKLSESSLIRLYEEYKISSSIESNPILLKFRYY